MIGLRETPSRTNQLQVASGDNSKMIIGVDASCWANKRGYGRYTRELLSALFDADQRNEYRLFIYA